MKPNNLVDMVFRTVQRHADKTALAWKSEAHYRRLTYGEFWQAIRRTASGLAALGVGKDDKVAILSENHPKWPVADLAIMSLGAVSVPIHATLPADQVLYILNNADCETAIVQNGAQLEKVVHGADRLRRIVVIEPPNDMAENERVFGFSKLEEIGARPLENWEATWRDIGRDHLATIIHTSGTTGNPKGAMLTHGNILANIEGVQFWMLEARPDDVLLSHLPLSHVFERMAGQFVPLSVGATIAYAESIDALPRNLLEWRPTVLVSVPLLFEKVYARVMEKIESGTPLRRKIFDWAVRVGMERYEFYLNHSVDEFIRRGELPGPLRRRWKLADKLVYSKVKRELGGRLRGLISGGGGLNPEIARFFWAVDLPVLEGYGLTETSPVVATNPMVRAKVGTVGKPLPNLEVRLAPDGEILVRGPSVMKGYYKDEAATKEQFEDGWFKTGDLGEIDEDGYLKILDRKKRILVLKTGKNVAPQPVENAMNQSLYIKNSVLVGHGQKYVIALIVPDFEQLVPWARQRGIAAEPKALIMDDRVQSLLRQEVARFTQRFARFEQPKKVLILSADWTTETGELTPSLKVRVPEIEKRYRDVIERCYAEEVVPEYQMAANEWAASVEVHPKGGTKA
jgi:long-chain acyl-CoA synthetase